MANCANCGLSFSEIKNQLLLQSGVGQDIEKLGEHIYNWILQAEKEIGTFNGLSKVFNYEIENDSPKTLTPLPDDVYQLEDAKFCQPAYYTGSSSHFVTSCNCGCSTANNCTCIKWFVNGCNIQTSRKIDKVTISYLAVSLDDDGFPYVKEGHLAAIIAYIKYMLLQSRFDEGKVPMGVYNTRYREWLVRKMAARSKDEIPNDAEMRTLANIWNAKLPVHFESKRNMPYDYVLIR